MGEFITSALLCKMNLSACVIVSAGWLLLCVIGSAGLAMFFNVTASQQGVQSIFYGCQADVRAELHDVGFGDFSKLAVKHCLNPVWLAHAHVAHVLNPVFKLVVAFEDYAQVVFHKREVVIRLFGH